MPSTDPRDTEDPLVAAVRDLMVVTDSLRTASARHYDLNTSDITALSRLAACGPLTASELAAALHLTGASVTAVADRLEKRGLAKRVAHPSDRRRVVVELTDKGFQRIRASRGVMAVALAGVPDQEKTAALVADLARRLRDAETDVDATLDRLGEG